jgi:hypothetical protein
MSAAKRPPQADFQGRPVLPVPTDAPPPPAKHPRLGLPAHVAEALGMAVAEPAPPRDLGQPARPMPYGDEGAPATGRGAPNAGSQRKAGTHPRAGSRPVAGQDGTVPRPPVLRDAPA